MSAPIIEHRRPKLITTVRRTPVQVKGRTPKHIANVRAFVRHQPVLAKRKKQRTHTVNRMRPDMPKQWTEAGAKPSTGVRFRPTFMGNMSGSSVSILKRWNPNSIWEPETGGSTGGTPFYAQWAAIYGFYRVIEYSWSLTITNKEAFDVVVCVSQSCNDPGTSTANLLASNPHTQTKEISAKGGLDKVTFKGKMEIAELAGEDAVYTDDSFRSLIGTSPIDLMWLGITVTSFGSNLTLGVDYLLKLTQKTEMFDILIQLSTPAQLLQIQQHRKLLRKLLKKAVPEKPPLIC